MGAQGVGEVDLVFVGCGNVHVWCADMDTGSMAGPMLT